MALSWRVPFYRMKFIPIWLQNSTPKPRLVTRLTTSTALISSGYPPTTTFSIQQIPMSSKKVKNTESPTKSAMYRPDRIWRATMIAPTPITTFWKSTPLMYVY